MTMIGYARVPTDDKLLVLQLDVLTAAGCGRVFEDTANGAKSDCAGLAVVVAACASGDVLKVRKLGRLGRSMVVERLKREDLA